MSLPRSAALLLLLALLTVHPLAQAEQSYTAAKIVFSNLGPYTQAQLETATQLHAGSKFSADDLGAAAQRLIDTGFFSDVGATLAGSTNAASVLFDTKPIERAQMLHVGFENFVWLTRAEIETLLQAKSPLFAGYLPESSPLADVFNTALTDALAAKGITAKVTHDTIEPTMLLPERVLEFRIASPSIRASNLHIAGIATDLIALIQKSAAIAIKAPYTEGLVVDTTADRILAPLLNAGYIQAAMSGVALVPTLAGNAATVDLSATLVPGDIYHVSSITFSGTPLISAEAFAVSQKLHAGDIASRAALLETLAPIDAAYRNQGYMDVVIQSSPRLDLAAHQVAYTITVQPGQQYRLKEITLNNLDSAARADFDRGWTMKTGTLYSPEYANTFLKKNTALQALAGYSAAYKAYADPTTHTVDLVITFFRAAR